MDTFIEQILAFCSIDSTTGREKAAIDYLETLLLDHGWQTQRQPVGPEKGRDNLWAFLEDHPPEVLLTTHVDTVPEYIPPRRSEDGQRLIGRGVCDAKGIAICMIAAAEELKKRGVPIGLLFVVGEETDSCGAKATAHFGIKVRYVINGEPTQLKLVRAMKGVIAFRLECQGVAAHSAYPEAGHSAIHQLVHDINRLIYLNWPSSHDIGMTTCNIGTIQGGKASNVIADAASAQGVIRTTIKSDQIVEIIQANIHPKTLLTITTQSDPQYLTVVKGLETDTVSFGSDIPYLRAIGEPLLFGPGSILDAHTQHEQVNIADLKKAIELYITLAEHCLNGSTIPFPH